MVRGLPVAEAHGNALVLLDELLNRRAEIAWIWSSTLLLPTKVWALFGSRHANDPCWPHRRRSRGRCGQIAGLKAPRGTRAWSLLVPQTNCRSCEESGLAWRQLLAARNGGASTSSPPLLTRKNPRSRYSPRAGLARGPAAAVIGQERRPTRKIRAHRVRLSARPSGSSRRRRKTVSTVRPRATRALVMSGPAPTLLATARTSQRQLTDSLPSTPPSADRGPGMLAVLTVVGRRRPGPNDTGREVVRIAAGLSSSSTPESKDHRRQDRGAGCHQHGAAMCHREASVTPHETLRAASTSDTPATDEAGAGPFGSMVVSLSLPGSVWRG